MFSVSAPLRLSLAGGGTDLPEWYLEEGAALLSVAIDRRIQVDVGSEVDDASGELVELFRGMHPGIAVHVRADCPPGAGLGGSGSLAVCLVAAHWHLEGEERSPLEIALEAYRWEREILGSPVGFQDQVAAGLGGAVFMNASSDGDIEARTDEQLTDDLEHLCRSAFVIGETPLRRDANVLLRALSTSALMTTRSTELRPATVESMTAAVKARDGALVGELLRGHWEAKRRNLPDSTNEVVDDVIAAALEAGATGAKLVGAGAGGFVLASGPAAARDQVVAALAAAGCRPHAVSPERLGVTVTTQQEQ